MFWAGTAITGGVMRPVVAFVTAGVYVTVQRVGSVEPTIVKTPLVWL
jgi:hypothetical protein